MEREEEEWVGRVLAEAARRKIPHKLLSVESKAAVAKGDNFTSELLRLKLRMQLMDGSVVTRSAIYKSLPSTEFRHKFIKEYGFFHVEGRMYQEVLPMLESIRQEYEAGDSLWGECYAIKPQENLLLEDLSVSGYKMGQRKKGLDFEHSSKVLRALGKFHALTAVLKERGNLIVGDYNKHLVERNGDIIETYYCLSYQEMARKVETEWEPEWAPYGEALRKLSSTLVADILKSFERDETKFNVLNHGDCWVNNVLFKYDEENKPISMKFIDFQLSFYNSPCFDLQYFLSTSIQNAIRPREIELVQLYLDSLLSNLQLFGYSGRLPTMEDIEEGLNKAALFGLSTAISLLPIIMMESPDDIPDMEECLKKYAAKEEIQATDFCKHGEEFKKAIKSILLSCKEKGIIKL